MYAIKFYEADQQKSLTGTAGVSPAGYGESFNGSKNVVW